MRIAFGSVFSAALVSVFLAGAAQAQPYPPPTYPPVPPPRVEVVPVAPGPRYMWEPGHWHWIRGQYAWIVGHYVVRGPGEYIPGHWAVRAGAWVWLPAHWR